MKKFMFLGLGLFVALSSMGCATAGGSPVSGILFTVIKAPSSDIVISESCPTNSSRGGITGKEGFSASDSRAATKSGTASCHSILGLFAIGDCGIDAAKKAGGINKVTYIDHSTLGVLFLYGSYTTVVYGD